MIKIDEEIPLEFERMHRVVQDQPKVFFNSIMYVLLLDLIWPSLYIYDTYTG